MKHHAGLPDFAKLRVWRPRHSTPAADYTVGGHEKYETPVSIVRDDELRRLWAIETAALKVMGSCRRVEGALVPTLGTVLALQALEATLQQDEEDS
jgi:hypothetical protein